MLTNLQNLPAGVWVAAILVLVAASVIGIWLHRNYKLGKLKLKAPWVEAELDRKAGEKPAVGAATAPPPAQPQRTQEMTRSEEGEQEMHGKGGVQKQKMTDSPGGKQKMD